MRPIIFFLSILLIACEAPKMPLPGITGKAGELVVVMDESLWKGSAGDTVFATMAQDVYGLPQSEPMFNVVHIKSSAFTKIFQTHRNLVVAHIGKGRQSSIQLKTDVWATPQVVIELSAPTVAEFVDLFGKNSEKIIGHIMEKENQRTLRSYNAQLNHDAVSTVKSKWGLKLSIPKGYHVVSDTTGFTWIRYQTQDVTQSILIHTEPYTDPQTFELQNMLAVIDDFTKKNVPGPDPSTYMSTFMEYPPRLEKTSIANNFAARVTGLWNVEGALMGGPFVSYAFLDASEKNVFYLHGFVFAPGENKRNYLRQVDAILNSAVVQ